MCGALQMAGATETAGKEEGTSLRTRKEEGNQGGQNAQQGKRTIM